MEEETEWCWVNARGNACHRTLWFWWVREVVPGAREHEERRMLAMVLHPRVNAQQLGRQNARASCTRGPGFFFSLSPSFPDHEQLL